MEAEQAIAAFEVDRALNPLEYHALKVKRYQGQDMNGNRWCLFVVYATYIGTEETAQARRAIAEAIRKKFHSEKKSVDRAFLTERPAWLADYLNRSEIR